MIDKAFKELRYDDVRDLLDNFLKENQDKEEEIIRAHYQKALSYMQEIKYHEAKEEFEHIGPAVKDTEILNDYGGIYYKLGEYDKAIDFHNKALKIQLITLGEKHPSTVISYAIFWRGKISGSL